MRGKDKIPINQFSLQAILAEKILDPCAARESRAAEKKWRFAVSSNAGRTNMLLPETYSEAYADAYPDTCATCVFLSTNYACSYTFIASLIKTNQSVFYFP